MALRLLGGGMGMPAVSQLITSQRLYTQAAVQSGDTLSASTTAEQPFASGYTIPANSLSVGQSVAVRGWGLYTTTTVAPPSQRARLRLGGVTLIDTGALSFPISLASYRYKFDLEFIVRATGTSGSLEASGELHFNNLTGVTIVMAGPGGAGTDAGNPVTVNTTADMPVALSVQFGFALAGNSSSLRQLTMSSLKPGS